MRRRIVPTRRGSKNKEREERVKALPAEASAPDSCIELIRMLISLGSKAMAEGLERLVSARDTREQSDQKRWRSNLSSVFLGEQKVSVTVAGGGNTQLCWLMTLTTSAQHVEDDCHEDDHKYRANTDQAPGLTGQ